ncbi:MAG: UDP-N-acetylmuramoyl-L-alanyl-D-glutamate--2,6-diaminopimelate ligase [Clostridia bacterium]|nr:UDP-N-acetylmuramoyl-L-alanyl-D-glutamate--2,6-diaminopimelate ligase [Clostridia bacterium]
MKLLEICQRAGIKCPEHLEKTEVEGISSRSYEIKENYVFVCLNGTRADGHNYIDAAILNGAVAVVIENENFLCENAILVDNTRVALANMMNAFCLEPTKDLRFIGITGTNGKTSVAAMLKHIFDYTNHPSEVIGTLNCSSFSIVKGDPTANFTTPDPEELFPLLQRMRDGGIKTVIMEASSHALKLQKLAPINFEIGIFTNLSEDHLDFHFDMEDYFNSKLRLFEKCKLGIINVDDEYGKRIVALAPCQIKTCSAEQNADFVAKEIEIFGEDGTQYKIETQENIFENFCGVPGQFSVMNSMQACACALMLNIDKNDILRSFKSFRGVKGRLEKCGLFEGRGFAVFIDYAHTPDALLKVLITINSFKKAGQRTVLVFGCGGDREKQKRSLMGEIAVQNADFVIVTSDNPRSEKPNLIINDILLNIIDCDNFAVIPNRKNAIEYAIATARAGDIILLAGKGHENYEINALGRFHFDEREILEEMFKKYYEKEK